jgi:ribosomal protein S3AE
VRFANRHDIATREIYPLRRAALHNLETMQVHLRENFAR